MIQCHECEYFRRDEQGRISFACDPFVNIKEPECLQKWALIKINQMVESYQATLGWYRKMAPFQDKLFNVMERELSDMDEGDRWKQPEDEEPPDGADGANEDGENEDRERPKW